MFIVEHSSFYICVLKTFSFFSPIIQVGKFLRTIACTDTQFWAGLECGIRVWNFSDQYKPGMEIGERARRADEDGAPFHESTNTSPTLCFDG